jgi:hypothetical protein
MAAGAQADSPGTTAQPSQGTSDATSPSLDNLVPTVTDAPKGQVTIGDKAGAFGPWRAHRVVDEIAKEIAGQAVKQLGDTGPAAPRVLVVEDRLLLPGDWTAHYVRSTLVRMKNQLTVIGSQLDQQKTPLEEAIKKLGQEEPEPAAPAQDPSASGRRRSSGPAAAADATDAAKTPDLPTGGLAAAINLLGLLRTDYTITATSVSAAPSELATLTAAHLTRTPAVGDGGAPVTVKVEADSFAITGPSPAAELFAGVLKLRDSTVMKLSGLQAILAPAQAELTAINTRTTTVEQAWAAAIADKKDDGGDIALLQTILDTLAAQAARREQAIGAAATAATSAQQFVTDIDTAMTALLQVPAAGGDAPLYTAVRNERIGQAVSSRKITHVLYVNLDAIAADAVTRQSILGTSGRIRFLSAGNASWLLLNTADGAIAGGGQESLADVATFSLETGKAHFSTTGGLASSPADAGDPLDKLEFWAKGLVAVLAVVLFAVGVLSVIAVVRLAFGK